MHARWRRALVAAGVVLCGLLLAGCDATGTVVVQADDSLLVDVVMSGSDLVSGDDTDECPTQLDSLAVAPEPTPKGILACRITGTIPASQLTQLIAVRTIREYKVVTVALQPDDLTLQGALDLTIRFPGEVLESSGGQIQGDSVRITKPADFHGLTIVALNRPGPEGWVIGAAAGVLGTLLVIGAAWLLRWRRTRTDAAPASDPSAGQDPPPDEADSAYTPELFAPPAFAPDASDWTPPADSSVPEPDAPATEYDHSIWAPPEDGGSGPID